MKRKIIYLLSSIFIFGKGYWINGIKIGDIEIGFKDKRTYLGVLSLE